jgi:hypothetical protein
VGVIETVDDQGRLDELGRHRYDPLEQFGAARVVLGAPTVARRSRRRLRPRYRSRSRCDQARLVRKEWKAKP